MQSKLYQEKISQKGPQMADLNQREDERERQNKILSNQEIIEKILFLQKQALDKAPFYV